MSLDSIMCLEVLHLLHNPYAHALVRSAGSRGVAVYKELVEAGGVPFSTELLVAVPPAHVAHVALSCIPGRPTTFKLLSSTVVAFHTAMAKQETSLTRCVFLEGFDNVTNVGNSFFSGFTTIKEIDLSPLRNVTAIGDAFLQDCSALTPTINLAPLSNVVTIGTNFLVNCKSLESIDFAPLGKVTTIGSHFMFLCSNIVSCDIAGLKSVISVSDDFFFFGCSALENAVAEHKNNRGDGDDVGGCTTSPFCSVELSSLNPELQGAARGWLDVW